MGDTVNDDYDDGEWGTSNIDLVAEPVRYPRSPLIALIALAVLPALGFLLLHRWADGEADAYEASRGATGLFAEELEGNLADDASPTTEPTNAVDDDIDAFGSEAPVLATSVFDYRRAPDAVASVASAGQLDASVTPVFGFLGPTSCAALAVDGITLSMLNADVPVIPASNQKLFVAIVALEILGPDYRFTTSVATPPAEEGVIDGDIYLIGGGDPLLTSDDYPIEDDSQPVVNATSFDALADGLVDTGITRIRGTVIGDGTRYDDEWVIEDWAEDVAFNEAGPYDSLLANDARVRGRSGLQDDPNEGAAREFVRLLNDRGIRVDNGWGSGVASTLVPVVATVDSEPLSAIVGEMLLTSDNNTAEMLLKEIGFVSSGEGTRAAGLNALTQTVASMGIDMEGVTFRDGSGLSNTNRVTCAALLGAVQIGRGTAVDAGLAVAAAETGTLADEFVGTEMAGRLRGKTGTLTDVKALAGVVDPRVGDTRAGTIEFVVVLNTAGADGQELYQPLWSAIGDRFATYPAGPSSDALGPR